MDLTGLDERLPVGRRQEFAYKGEIVLWKIPKDYQVVPKDSLYLDIQIAPKFV